MVVGGSGCCSKGARSGDMHSSIVKQKREHLWIGGYELSEGYIAHLLS